MTNELKTKIELYFNAKDAYYQGEPLMSDQEFDKLEEELILQGFDPVVGFDDIDDSDKINHRNKMLSLRKKQIVTENGQMTIEMANEIFNKYGTGLLSFKYDGMAGEAQYKNGKLIAVVSRGNGDKGRNLFPKLHDLLPQQLNSNLDVDIRFEICMAQSVFDKKYSKEVGGKYSHARNLVAGIVRDENVNDERKFDLSFITIEAIDTNAQMVDIETTHEFYVKNYKTFYTCNDAIELLNNFNESVKTRFELDFPTDGMVHASNTNTSFEHDGKYPDYATSIKFAPPVTTSKVKDIQWKLHKTGRYVPMIIIEPVTIDGRKISRASGHNWMYLANNNITIGAEVKIVISNDIIPMVKSL